jgi:hypothetical protein
VAWSLAEDCGGGDAAWTGGVAWLAAGAAAGAAGGVAWALACEVEWPLFGAVAWLEEPEPPTWRVWCDPELDPPPLPGEAEVA